MVALYREKRACPRRRKYTHVTRANGRTDRHLQISYYLFILLNWFTSSLASSIIFSTRNSKVYISFFQIFVVDLDKIKISIALSDNDINNDGGAMLTGSDLQSDLTVYRLAVGSILDL